MTTNGWRVGFIINKQTDQSASVLVPSKTNSLGCIVGRKIIVHDRRNEASQGDCVLIEKGQKISKNKKWHIVRIVSMASLLPKV